MYIGSYPCVDPTPIRNYYQERGLSLEILNKCNSQEFRYIDGAGEGYFLLTANQVVTGSTVRLNSGSRPVDLEVTDVMSLEHMSSSGLQVIKTAEPKYVLKSETVDRNYNITIDKSISSYGATTIITESPDLPVKSIEEVIADFTGLTVNWYSDYILGFDIPIAGMSQLDAIDYLCRIYGLVWTHNGTDINIWDMDANAETSSEQNQAIAEPYNDIRHSILTSDPKDISVIFPTYDYCRKEPSETYVYDDSNGAQGKRIVVSDPLYPEVVAENGTTRNASLLNTRGELIVEHIRGIEDSLEYLCKHHYDLGSLNVRPLCLSEVIADYGSGPRTIYRKIPYPYYKPDKTTPNPRYANNWIGAISKGYFGTVSWFEVLPVIGLDGKVPPGLQAVYNIYNWDYGQPTWAVRVEWDCTNARWIALQQEYDCPPESDPEYPAPTYPNPEAYIVFPEE